MLVMAMSNKYGYIPLNTSNKSEAAVGYGTLYGDLCGSLGTIGDVFKTDIYALARYINRNQIIIPENTIQKHHQPNYGRIKKIRTLYRTTTNWTVS